MLLALAKRADARSGNPARQALPSVGKARVRRAAPARLLAGG